MQLLDASESVLVFRRTAEWVGKQPSPTEIYGRLGFRTNDQPWHGKAPGTCILAGHEGRADFPNGRPIRLPKAGVVVVTTLIGFTSGGWELVDDNGTPNDAGEAHTDYGAAEADGLLGEFVGEMTPAEAAKSVEQVGG